MPRIFDNIEQDLLPALQETLEVSQHADFCVGYFNLRGWKRLDHYIERWSGGEGSCCRLLVGMHRALREELRSAIGLPDADGQIDNQTALRRKKELADEFREQLASGTPSNEDEACLRRLARQIREKKVVIKLFLRHPLHAKLYLLFRPDPINPIVSYLGSSNLTLADHDACNKLAQWFEDRWNDRWCIDISAELVRAIEESWAAERLLPPYHIYLKMAYHLSREAREGLHEFRIPRDFVDKLTEFQVAAVKIAAHHLVKRGGVFIGDVVGYGKTLMATAVARIFEDQHDLETLILCPRNLVPMWEDYRTNYRLRGKVLSSSMVSKELPKLRRYRVVVIDESHHLRNREGKRYRAIHEYIRENESKVVLLSATPYNKSYLDLSSQLRLFVPDDQDVGIRPECLLRELGDDREFIRRHQCGIRTLAAFEKSLYPDDWREFMRLYLVRRTRTFIQENYAKVDANSGRKYIEFPNGARSYFPARKPKRINFAINDRDPADQYALLYSDPVVDAMNHLTLPRYGLGNYVVENPKEPPTTAEAKIMADLSRAGIRLKGFCRTNLFKRLESSGQAFIQSVERHILRNFVYLHALANDLPVPIGTQDANLLDSRVQDQDAELFADDDDNPQAPGEDELRLDSETDFQRRAGEIYQEYSGPLKRRFRWLPAERFQEQLQKDLRGDARALLGLLNEAGPWNPDRDAKLQELVRLITRKHANQKVLVFSQFADTVTYLVQQLRQRGVARVAGATGDSEDPTRIAWRFSPVSNGKLDRTPPEQQIDVLVATDVLSEGQNLQDAAIVVNYDLPWAIIRLIQRAGRVDRIGQQAETITCYTFLPAEGVERIIHLRERVRQRLRENAEVVGTDEVFFEDDRNDQAIRDLFTEKAGILDGEEDTEVDLASQAFQIWKNALDRDPTLERKIRDLPNVVYSTKPHVETPDKPEGVLVYVRTAEDNDALAWLDKSGRSITESQLAILKAAECTPETPALPRHDNHHDLVRRGVESIAREEKSVGGQLGRPSGARFRTYDRLKQYAQEVKGTIYDSPQLRRAVEDIHNYPLRQLAVDILNKLLRSGIPDDFLAQRAIELREEGRLSIIHDEDKEVGEPQIICSLGLAREGGT